MLMLFASISICLSIQAQQTDTIQFNNCFGIIDGPGTWGIVPSDVASCFSGSNWEVNLDVEVEKKDSYTKMGVLWEGSYFWVLPIGYSGGSSPIDQFIILSGPGLYSVHNGGQPLRERVRFISAFPVYKNGIFWGYLKDFGGTINVPNSTDLIVVQLNSFFVSHGTSWHEVGGVEVSSQQTSYTLQQGINELFTRDGVGPNPTYSQTVTVNFPQSGSYTITATAGANGTISPSGTITVPHGGNQTYTITPSTTCYEIDQVLVNGVNNSNAVLTGSYTFTNVTSNQTIHATFKLKPLPTITATAGANGTISPSGTITVNCGGNQTFTITPSTTCYEIDQVLVNGVNNPGAVSSGSYTFTNVTSNQTIHATFKLKQYTITASAGPNGNISPSGATTVNCGASPTFNFSPDGGYTIHEVTVDGIITPTGTSYTFPNVTANHTIHVTFVAATVPVTGITLNKTSTGLLVGEFENLIATVLPTNATNQNVYWVSHNTNIVTVDQTGKITGVAPGWTVIEVFTQEGNFSATCSVEVSIAHIPVTEVTLNHITWSANVGDDPLQLIATITPTNATNQNVTWHSTNPSVAIVNNGWVTFLSEGTTDIIVTTEDGGKTATCHIIVGTPQYTITVAANNNAWGTVTGGGVFNAGNSATVIATPATNYRFVDWKENGVTVYTDSLYTFVVEQNRSLIANFEENVGISDKEINHLITVYPNPTTGELRIENGELRISNVEIFDSFGRKLTTYHYPLITINISHFPAGVYFLRISTEVGEVIKKVLKE